MLDWSIEGSSERRYLRSQKGVKPARKAFYPLENFYESTLMNRTLLYKPLDAIEHIRRQS